MEEEDKVSENLYPVWAAIIIIIITVFNIIAILLLCYNHNIIHNHHLS